MREVGKQWNSMIERMEMIIYIEKCREKESRKDAERERLTE